MKQNIIILVIIVVAVYLIKPDLFSLSSGAFDEDGNPVTMIFTVSECKGCGDAVEFFEKREIEYTEYNIDENDENMKLWKKYSKKNVFPTIVSGDLIEYGFYKIMLISHLALVYGDYALSENENYFMRNHFDDEGIPRVFLYLATWCPYCTKLKQKLNEKNILFEYVDVDISNKKDFITETLDVAGFPIAYVGYNRFQGSNKEIVKNINKTLN